MLNSGLTFAGLSKNLKQEQKQTELAERAEKRALAEEEARANLPNIEKEAEQAVYKQTSLKMDKVEALLKQLDNAPNDEVREELQKLYDDALNEAQWTADVGGEMTVERLDKAIGAYLEHPTAEGAEQHKQNLIERANMKIARGRLGEAASEYKELRLIDRQTQAQTQALAYYASDVGNKMNQRDAMAERQNIRKQILPDNPEEQFRNITKVRR